MSGCIERARVVVVMTVATGASLFASPHAVAAAVKADASVQTAPALDSYKEIKWVDLLPKNWNPAKFMPARPLGFASDLDPEVQVAFAEMRLAFDNAPTVAAMDGASVKLPGYLVPLEEVRGEMKEFLLVPYFGACIHTPPPPANQIVFVRLKAPVRGFHAMDTVWVAGRLAATRQSSDMGVSGYEIDAVSVDRYVPPSR
jgi:hypothetical protein